MEAVQTHVSATKRTTKKMTDKMASMPALDAKAPHTRRTFLKEATLAAVGTGMINVNTPVLGSELRGGVASRTTVFLGSNREKADPMSGPRIAPMLWGGLRLDTNLEAWFESMKRWGVQKWMSYAVFYRPDRGQPHPILDPTVPFLEDAWPGFVHVNTEALAAEEAAIRKMASLCAKHEMEFWYLIPFPLFPTTDPEAVKKAAPYFFRSGRVNIYEPRLAELLKAEVRQFKKILPTISGVTLLLAEGAGSMGNLTADDLDRNKEWENPLIRAFSEVTQELKIKGMVSGHHYLETVRAHRNVYEVMSAFPELTIMDDTTWPEEDMLHPFLGYLPEQDRELLFKTNPVALKVLLDTEYIGQGILPGVYPRWWKYNVSNIVRSGAQLAIGRTFFWDGGYTDVNFNRLNAYSFVRFCHDPDADARQVLGEAVAEFFGPQVPERLIDILWETEPVIKKVIGVNGVDSLMHSRFPKGEFLDIVYTPQGSAMKAIDDLFRPPGTTLYSPLTDALNNYKQWRWQNKTVSESADTYLAEKREAADWIQAVLPEVRQLSVNLDTKHRYMFVHGYDILACLASGMNLFVETAALHYKWAHAKTMDDREAKEKFHELAVRCRALAAQTPNNPFHYQEGILSFADYLENNLPRIGSDPEAKHHPC